MKKIVSIIISLRMTIILLLIFLVGIGTATFIEDKYDTTTARLLVYNAWWFDVVLALLALNFIGNIKRYKFFSWKKAPNLIFHLAFIILIIGAGVTRFTGFEGSMHIRKDEASNIIYSSVPYFQAKCFTLDKSETLSYEKPLLLSEAVHNRLHISMNVQNSPLSISYKKFLKNAVEKAEENKAGGSDILGLSIAGENGNQSIYIKDGEIKDLGKIAVAFNQGALVTNERQQGTNERQQGTNERKQGALVTNERQQGTNERQQNTNERQQKALVINERQQGKLYIVSPFNIRRSQMMLAGADTIIKNTEAELAPNYIYNTNGVMFAFSRLYKNAKMVITHAANEENAMDALTVEVNYKDKTQEVNIFGGSDHIANYQNLKLDGVTLELAYGQKPIELPFSLYLNEFILTRYPGSMSPSSYASEVTLLDKTNNLKEEHRIFMNNVLDYKGYRFYQASYDMDEKGTILSVNHDFWGTWITYTGYILLGIGFLFTLLSKNSRYYVLRQKIHKLREMRKAVTAMIILFLCYQLPTASSQQQGNIYQQSANGSQQPVSNQHADKFGHLLVQTFDGRFEPVNTLAIDVLHKISRKDKFNIEGKGSMNEMQAFIDMFINTDSWKTEKIIYIREQSVKDFLGIKGMYATFNDFFDQQGKYRLSSILENAFRKKPIEQNTFDREIIKVDERVNILMEVFKGSLLKIFPLEGSTQYKWVDWSDSLAMKPITSSLKILNEDLQLREFSFTNIFKLYFTEVFNATRTGDFTRADKICSYIESIQRQSPYADILPTKSMVDTEIFYNKANIFVALRNWYGLLSVVLLLLAFIDNLKQKKSKIISYTLNVFIGLLGIAFLYHTFGLGLRWYLTGHAPWSNGYEALLLIAWGGLLAGFSFVRYSKITTAATAVLASIILMVAGLSSYDPQLTNLQPVLKSYWLIVHVAVITISYGFLALGFVLGLINLIIYLFRTAKNEQRTTNVIKELTYINEMNLSVGIFLATLGTFLGGIWANESWGRYWGWDAKETWALAIIVTYAIILHFRLIPSLKSIFIFNVMSVLGFGSVIMTFVGVNYYLSKGLHSYASGETPVFPIWAWIMILCLILLMIIGWIKERMLNNTVQSTTITEE